MSVVDELFDKAVDLKIGKEIRVNCGDKKQLHSLRTMIYRQSAKYEKQTGTSPDIMCSKEGTTLVIQKRSFEIEEED